MSARTSPYASWKSPITAELLAEGEVGLSQPQVSGGEVYWLEQRPAEDGRYVIMRRTAGGAEDVIPRQFNARTRVHEYGGGAYLASGSTVFFSNFEDQRLYRADPGEDPVAITPEPATAAALRYADARLTPDGGLLVCVRESHEGDEVVNDLVTIPADGARGPEVVASGGDFYSFPRISPDGRRIAWTAWDHPRMPWDGTELYVAELTSDGMAREPQVVAGGAEESVFQPEWSPDGTLHFVSDRTGWWNLYRRRGEDVEPLAAMEAEFGEPQWAFGLSTYAFLDDGRIVVAYSTEGIKRLGTISEGVEQLEPLETRRVPAGLSSLAVEGTSVVFAGAGATEQLAIVALDLGTGSEKVLATSSKEEIDPAYIAAPCPVEFPTEDHETAHAIFYPPANPDYVAPLEERPPLLVMSHGGPTAHAEATLNLEIQFWTSRGFAVVDVNYRGSTGYGRVYRERLRGRWGLVDTIDCINAARHLVDQGEVDGRRLAIRGGSAGGYTTLCALAFHDAFDAGASYYGVADAELLAKDTHKFESRYLDGLIGPYPEAAELYRERSPIYAADHISSAVILLQGLEDEVVPPSQAVVMVEALERNGVPYAYLAFEGEQHGFRRAETIRRAQESELYFYSRLFGFEPADSLPEVEIHNM